MAPTQVQVYKNTPIHSPGTYNEKKSLRIFLHLFFICLLQARYHQHRMLQPYGIAHLYLASSTWLADAILCCMQIFEFSINFTAALDAPSAAPGAAPVSTFLG